MSNWQLGLHPTVTIIPTGIDSIGASSQTAPASAVWPSANAAVYIPFRLYRPVLVSIMYVYNGATVSGNFDLGIYDVAGTRLTSSGSTAQSGINALQTVTIAGGLVLGSGLFYVALAVDNTTATVFRQNIAANLLAARGLAEQATAFALPATATFATMSAVTILPMCGLATRSFA